MHPGKQQLAEFSSLSSCSNLRVPRTFLAMPVLRCKGKGGRQWGLIASFEPCCVVPGNTWWTTAKAGYQTRWTSGLIQQGCDCLALQSKSSHFTTSYTLVEMAPNQNIPMYFPLLGNLYVNS